jgi:hypothetical protein
MCELDRPVRLALTPNEVPQAAGLELGFLRQAHRSGAALGSARSIEVRCDQRDRRLVAPKRGTHARARLSAGSGNRDSRERTCKSEGARQLCLCATSASNTRCLSRPLLKMGRLRQLAAAGGNGFGLFRGFEAQSICHPFATGCNPAAPQRLHQRLCECRTVYLRRVQLTTCVPTNLSNFVVRECEPS